jgi:hypothetical protein
VALSLGIWKNGDRRTKRATNMSTTPEATTPTTDQSCGRGQQRLDQEPGKERGRPEGKDAHEHPSAALLRMRRRKYTMALIAVST